MKDVVKRTLGPGITLLSIYFAYDLPGSMNYSLGFDKETEETKISMLYSAYAIPNILLPYIFGHLLYLSKQNIAVFLTLFVLFGQIIFTAGVFMKNFAIMLIGRVLFGIGGESYSVVQNKLMTEYFKAADLVEAMSLYNTCGRIGTVLTFLLVPVISNLMGAFTASILSCILILVGFYSCYTTHLKIKESALDTAEYPAINTRNTSQSFVDIEETNESETKKHCKKQCFWLLIVLCFILGMLWSPFYNIAPMMYQKRFKLSSTLSSISVSMIEGLSMIISFFINPILRKKGNKLDFIIIGILILTMAHISLVVDLFGAYLSVILLGISAPFISFYWPCIPDIVEDEKLSSAFGVLYCVTNLAFAISPIFVALLILKSPTYFLVEIYLILLSISGILILIGISYINNKYNLGLNKPDVQIVI